MLAYDGEATEPIAFNATARELEEAISALVDSNVTVMRVNCSTPELTCSWRITFTEISGDVELLDPDAEGLEGNLPDVLVTEEVRGQHAFDVDGSPAMVRNSEHDNHSGCRAVHLMPLIAVEVLQVLCFCCPDDARLMTRSLWSRTRQTQQRLMHMGAGCMRQLQAKLRHSWCRHAMLTATTC